MMIAAPKSSSKNVEDGGNFSADSSTQQLNSDDEQLDDTPFLSHQLPDDHESFSEKFLRNILTHDYQNLMPRRREKFVEITKTVTVTEIVNGAPDKHPSSCEVKVTNVSPAGPHPVNVSIKHLHEKWHSCEELDKSDDGGDLGKGTIIRIQETHKPFNYTQKKQKPSKFVYEDVVNTKMESSSRSRSSPSPNSTLFNRSSDNIIDLEFRHPILVETNERNQDQKANGSNGTRRRFADLRKKVSTTTKTSVTETEKVTTTRRSSSAHSTSSRRSYSKPEVHTLYYRKFVDEETKGADDDLSDSGSVVIHRNSVTRRSQSADPIQRGSSPTMSPIAPPRKRLGREESLHYYRDDEEVIGEQKETEKTRRVTVRSPEPGNTSVSMNDTTEGRNLTAGITSISMNDSCTDTSYESRFSTIPRARSSPPATHRVNHIHVNVIGPIRTPETERRHRVVGRVGDDVTMDIFIERRHSASNSRRGSHVSHGSMQEAPPKPPRRSKYEDHIRIGDPIATSTPMTTIERKQTRDERISVESGESSRKSTRSARPPDINIIECETFLRETRSPARTPATPIVVINQTPSSRRGSQDLLGEPGQRRRKSTVTDIDWYAAFNMKDPSSPTKLARPPFASNQDESRKTSRDARRRASDSSMIGIPPADIDLNQIFVCTVPPEIKKDEKCQCNACRLIRMSEAERAQRIERASRSRQSRSYKRTTEYETRSSTLPSRHRTSPVKIELEDIFNPKPSHQQSSKPPTPPNRRRHAPSSPPYSPSAASQSSIVDESPSRHLVTKTIDRKQVTPVTTNSRDSGSQLHESTRNQLLKTSDDWVDQMINDANEWENRVSSRKSSVLSTSSSTARKVSVARRISVDELRKPEKRKSREAVPLPPSDVSIDDIFTALTPKKDDTKDTERKTFIVTRKQRAQDIDAIDFENDREAPVAPPRTKNTGSSHLSETTVTLENKEDLPHVSTATINLEDVISEDNSEKHISEKDDGRVEIPYNETNVTSTATIQMRPTESSERNQNDERESEQDSADKHEKISSETSKKDSDSQSEMNPNRTSKVSINLDEVFVQGTSKTDENEKSDEKIRRGIAEFERSKQEKEAQRSGIVITTHSSKHLFDESDISMDEVFNTSRTEKEASEDVKKPDEKETSPIVDEPREVVTSNINLDNVFVTGNNLKRSEEDEEDEHIRRRIEEFKRTTEEKESRMTKESHSSRRIFDESNISMDDVFNTRSTEMTSPEVNDDFNSSIKENETVETENSEGNTSSSINMHPHTTEITEKNIEHPADDSQSITTSSDADINNSSVTINLNDIFVEKQTKEAEIEDSDEKIQRGIAEFEKSKQEKEAQRLETVETHSFGRIANDSNISMRDVFNPVEPEEETVHETKTSSRDVAEPTEETQMNQETLKEDDDEKKNKGNRSPAVSIDLDKVFVQGTSKTDEKEESDEKIRRGIAEFERSKQEKEAQRSGIVVTTHSNKHLFDESDISMDDVFNTSRTKKEPSVDIKKPDEKESSSIVLTDEPREVVTSNIDLDNILVTGKNQKRSEEDEEDDHIRRRIEEFKKTTEEKENRMATESHSSRRIFDESDISMDDVFNASSTISLDDVHVEQEKKSDNDLKEITRKSVEEKKTLEHSDSIEKDNSKQESNFDGIQTTEKPNRVSEVSIDLDKIFVQGTSKTDENEELDEKIRRGIAEFERAKQEKEAQRSGIVVTTHSNKHLFDESDISMDDVFNTSRTETKPSVERKSDSGPQFILTTDEDETTKTKTTTTTETERDTSSRKVFESSISMHSSQPPPSSENVISSDSVEIGGRKSPSREVTDMNKNQNDTITINLDDVFVEQKREKSSEDEDDDLKIQKGIAEFERARKEKESQKSLVSETSTINKIDPDESNISMDDVFNKEIKGQSDVSEEHNTSIRMRKSDIDEPKTLTTFEKQDSKSSEDDKNEKRSSEVSIDLDKVFVQGSSKTDENEESDEKIRRGIAEFERSKQEKEAQRSGIVVTTHSSKHLFDESDISMDDVFNASRTEKELSVDIKKPDEKESSSSVLTDEPREQVISSINLDNVFVTGKNQKISEEDEEDEHIRRRIEEFKRTTEEKESRMTTESHSSRRIFEESNISMDDVFNASSSMKSNRATEEFPSESKAVFVTPSISHEEVPDEETSRFRIVETYSETEKTTTTTRTETSSNSYSKKSTTLDDLFGPKTATPPVISVSAISFNQPSSPPTPPQRKHQNLSSLLVPGTWNDSMISNSSTISLDDSFNNSFAKSKSSQVSETKLRKPLTLPVDNWIDNLVATVTDEATKEAPKTPKSAIENYFRSPTRISQEIKYEWIADLIDDNARKGKEKEEEGHQSEEEHLQKQDKTWVSSVVYRPTLETSAYTLRSFQMEPEQKTEVDMDKVFGECLMGKNKDEEECECSACRLTEKELEAMQKRKIETEKLTREEKEIVSRESEERKHFAVLNPSEFSIDDVFNPEVPLRIQTDNAQVPSTSSPPLQSTRTYYISPKISETVTTTHQWKDADISMDEIFSPVSSIATDNRRFSNFYEDRSGWDTIGSEDSGVMSGGDRDRRRSTRITDHVIDEAFKGIFDTQPTSSSQKTKPEHSEAHYDDYYITSHHQDEVDRSDSDVDGENLDVSQFVDDILGKSLDEAAFLSSTKSLRDHTDTSIDRKKSVEKVHSYYRTRTDTSMDRRTKPEVIKEDMETSETHSNDEILKLIFVDPADSSISKSESRRSLTLPRNKSITKPNDEELLEIEIKPEYFLIKGSYSLLIPKSDPLGIMLQKLREQNDSLATLDFSLTRKLKKLLVNCIRERAGDLEMASSKYEGLLSSRGQSLIESIDHASATFLKMNVDKYEPTRNPNGVVNFCTAENNICTPLLEERFKHLELFFPNTEHLVRYPPAGGWPEAREILVKYFKEFMGARVTIDELALTPSTRTGYDVTSYCLFEQDDILLTNGPAYAGTISNVQEKAQCQVVCVETDLSNPRLDVKMYEAELNRQTELENTVSGVIIVNPHNPLGVTFPPEEVVSLCNWAASKNLQVVIDEVFANCVFDKSNSKFRPFLSYRHRVHRPEKVAWLWSVSKDFGLPGLKFAVIHSANEGLRQAATKLQMYYPCSPFVQDFAINLLSDSDWLREFHAEVNRRISIHYRYTAQNLERLEIPFVPAQAGIFVFADFSKYLTSLDEVGELDLFNRIASAGVMLTPGVHQKCHVFGWFRIVFACTKEELEEGFRRLFAYLGSHLNPIGTIQYDN
uniref:Aminotran_1_2 domain-containing protein n=1 Tax=Caenorhabditis tropicalis TaxID=1561998 RepID=A0A1I7T5F4_9PELO